MAMGSNNLVLDTTHIALSYSNLLNQMPCAVGIKTVDSVYVAANQQVANLTGFTGPKTMIGIQDSDLKCPAAELYQTFILQDQEALSSNKISNLDICKYSDGQLHVFLSVKSKLVDDMNQPFVLFTMTELPIAAIAKIITNLSYTSIRKVDELSASYRIQNPRLCKEKGAEHTLSKRMSECLFLLLQGKSLKAIAYHLKISAKTVEEHIMRLKQVFKCYSKSELIEKAFSLGYAQIIPPSLLGLQTS